jgi:hypothetical protein
MKNTLQITAVLDKPEQLASLVEKLAYRRNDNGYSEQIVPANLKAFDTSSTEAFISGVVTFDGEEDIINMPFTTPFLFTCVKGKDEEYKLEWGISLS